MTSIDIERPLSQIQPLIWYHQGNDNLPKDTEMSDKQQSPEWITTNEASEMTGLKRDTIAEYCRRYSPESEDNKLVAKKIGRDWWVLRESIDGLERDSKNRGRPSTRSN